MYLYQAKTGLSAGADRKARPRKAQPGNGHGWLKQSGGIAKIKERRQTHGTDSI